MGSNLRRIRQVPAIIPSTLPCGEITCPIKFVLTCAVLTKSNLFFIDFPRNKRSHPSMSKITFLMFTAKLF